MVDTLQARVNCAAFSVAMSTRKKGREVNMWKRRPHSRLNNGRNQRLFYCAKSGHRLQFHNCDYLFIYYKNRTRSTNIKDDIKT